ncbi:hypothetical protein BS78_01G236300 [Paspalum vaginatum]|nr:hypothetical protein BS78_01G236300 [Paspalum vaginatum]
MVGGRSRRETREDDNREIPVEILQEILLRLPTKDVIRSSCVYKLWHSIIGDPSFCKLHDADHVATTPKESEVLLVGRGQRAKPFVRQGDAPCCHPQRVQGYRFTNVCNGFLCFARDHEEVPPEVVCNPVTGETLELPMPPLPLFCISVVSHHVLGFSPATKEYKMFRICCPHGYPWTERDEDNKMVIAVYTLGGTVGVWRHHSYLSRFYPRLTPMDIDGKLYVATADLAHGGERATQMLVVDVATETRRTYRLSYNYHDYHST